MESEVHNTSSQSVPALKESLRALELSMHIVENCITEEREAAQQDRFGRRASEMPTSLRKMYQSGAWKDHPVYLWPRVLELSQHGHLQAAAAEAAFAHISYKPEPPALELNQIRNAAISDAQVAYMKIGERLRKVLAAQRAARRARMKEQSKEYMQKRKDWIAKLDAIADAKSPEQRERARQRDRELLVATRASSGMGGGMSNKEIDVVFTEIEHQGGTAGGLERWKRSITCIPDQNPDYLPPASDGGGVLIDNPLADHYQARNINPWTRTERLLFLEKFVVHGKNFRKIATFFEHKSIEDCVRFYFDNKMRLGLKQIIKDAHLRKRANKKVALSDLSKLPVESRSIKDNFMHQTGFFSPDSQEDVEKQGQKADKLSSEMMGRSWSPADRQALVFALCRFDVSDDDESKPVPTIWASISAAVKNKTPRQCRQFYFQFKKVLGLDHYLPPTRPSRPSPKRPAPLASANEDETGPRKVPRRTNSVVKNNGTSVPSPVESLYANGGGTTDAVA